MEGQTLWVQQRGVAVPLVISGATQFAPGFDLNAVEPGANIVARVRLENQQDNVVQEIGFASRRGVGGAGQAGGMNPAAEQILQGGPGNPPEQVQPR